MGNPRKRSERRLRTAIRTSTPKVEVASRPGLETGEPRENGIPNFTPQNKIPVCVPGKTQCLGAKEACDGVSSILGKFIPKHHE